MRGGGGHVDYFASLAVSVRKLQLQNERLLAEPQDLQRQVRESHEAEKFIWQELVNDVKDKQLLLERDRTLRSVVERCRCYFASMAATETEKGPYSEMAEMCEVALKR